MDLGVGDRCEAIGEKEAPANRASGVRERHLDIRVAAWACHAPVRKPADPCDRIECRYTERPFGNGIAAGERDGAIRAGDALTLLARESAACERHPRAWNDPVAS